MRSQHQARQMAGHRPAAQILMNNQEVPNDQDNMDFQLDAKVLADENEFLNHNTIFLKRLEEEIRAFESTEDQLDDLADGITEEFTPLGLID